MKQCGLLPVSLGFVLLLGAVFVPAHAQSVTTDEAQLDVDITSKRLDVARQ